MSMLKLSQKCLKLLANRLNLCSFKMHWWNEMELWGILDCSRYIVHHRQYPLFTFAIDLSAKVTENVARYLLCTCKVWNCYIQWFRRCIYKKIYYLTFDLGSQGDMKRCPVHYTSCELWPCKIWSRHVKLLSRNCICKKKHNLTLYLGPGDTRRYPVPSTSCGIYTCKV